MFQPGIYMYIYLIRNYLFSHVAKVAYGGVFPSMDWRGHLFSGSRASLAGKHISGGPYTLTEVRLGFVCTIST